MTTPALAAPRGCTNLKLRQAGRLVTRHYEAYVRTSGLKITQYSLLSHVVKLGPLRAGDLAARMQLDASTLSRNLQPLVEQGWLRVRAADDDARSRVIEVTAAGLEVRAVGQRAWKRAQLALNERLGTDRVATLHALLDECIAILEPQPAENADE